MTKTVLNIRAPFTGLVLILASFFFTQQAPGAGPALDEVARSSGWKALLYYQDNSFIITDPKFYLSAQKTLLAELEAFTEELATERKQEVICRFPARYYFLAQKLGYPEEPLSHCEKLVEFKKRAPLEKAFVMFASENISIPSSMMGHIYLKLTGINHLNNDVEHAVSFYTDVDGINFPKLVVESLVLGKKGLYALSPSEPIKSKYILQEGRNVWEFELKLTKEQKILLQNHLYELKKIKLTYYFHTFNCATLIKQIVRVSNPVEAHPKSEHGLIESQAVNLSSKWKIKSLIESTEFEPGTITKVKKNQTSELIEHTEAKEKSYGFKSLELAKAYNRLLKEEDRIAPEAYETKSADLNQHLQAAHAGSVLDFSSYKTPTKITSTAQVMATYANEKNESVLKLTWLPASHLLEDESSQYISESELQISRITLAQNFKTKSFYLDEFNLYSATSFLPSDPLSNGLSGQFRIGYTNYFNSKLERERSPIVEGSLGKTYRLHNDVDFFGLAGLNYIEANSVVLAPDVETGFIVRAVYDMKTVVSAGYLSEDPFKDRSVLSLKLRHFLNLGSYGLVFEFTHLQNQKAESLRNYSVGLKRYF